MTTDRGTPNQPSENEPTEPADQPAITRADLWRAGGGRLRARDGASVEVVFDGATTRLSFVDAGGGEVGTTEIATAYLLGRLDRTGVSYEAVAAAAGRQ